MMFVTSSKLLVCFSLVTVALLTLGDPTVFPLHRHTPQNPKLSPHCAIIVRTVNRGGEGNDVFPYSFPPPPREFDASEGLLYIANFVPDLKAAVTSRYGEICITYNDVNAAIHEARTRYGQLPPQIYDLSSNYPEAKHIAPVGEVIEEATRILAHKFHLSFEVIINGLPQVDTTKTVAKEICPIFLTPVKCELTRYRTITGMCNNLDHPSWGSARSSMIRYVPPVYGDAISLPRRSNDGSYLPSPRVVSFFIHHDIGEHDRQLCNILVAWGQMIDHDMTFVAPTLDEHKMDIECCQYPPSHRHPNCLVIDIPHDDPFYKFFNKQCMDFARNLPGSRPGCTLGPRSQINTISSYIDGNFMYGSSHKIMKRLREYRGGRLRTLPLYRELGLKDILPMKMVDPDVGCTARPRNIYCFDAGDNRVNEQVVLTVMHVVWMREHNRIADALSHINPHWGDETIFQETRHIIVAELQHITYSEFLPVILGPDTMQKYGLVIKPHGYYEGYDVKINAGIRTAFQNAAFRFGHSLLPDATDRYNKFHDKLESVRLAKQLRQPYDLYKPGIIDSFIMGLVNQESNRMDPEVTTEVTNHLFEKPGERFGMDLAALNTQRGREHGIPGYNYYRGYCGLPKARNFYDLIGVMPNKTVHRYSQIYKSVDDIDLWSAGISEYPLPNAVVGPTFACLIGEQFSSIRRGDRFWYENSGWPSSFSAEQLQEIKKVMLCRVMCDNADEMETVQMNAMLISHQTENPRAECHGTAIPRMDLTKWADVNHYKISRHNMCNIMTDTYFPHSYHTTCTIICLIYSIILKT
ncbi:salivary peroxidase/catechol oxidase-like [Tachypleus tridentatus]|uniref:salivary peroxidase/catechol oxidase-like n=1 Tax=Tachypleus tridentatus TaxID=6853 RepID=UPI003FD1FE5C